MKELNYTKFKRTYTVDQPSRVCFSFHIHCSISKRGRLK